MYCFIGLVYSEAVWSLWKRDLPAFYGYDDNTGEYLQHLILFVAVRNQRSVSTSYCIT